MQEHVNEDWLERLRSEIGEDVVEEVVAIFIDETRQAAMRLPALDGREAAEMLHFLAGSAANLGFTELERAARAGFDPDTRAATLGALAARFRQACDALEARQAA
ncbi:MAG: Hpt domain-containing protein [Hasllibacter sp.]